MKQVNCETHAKVKQNIVGWPHQYYSTSYKDPPLKHTPYLLDVHVEQQLLEVGALVHPRVRAAPQHHVLLQGHGVQRQQQQAAGDRHRRRRLRRAGKELREEKGREKVSME
jgi:hypothetical protein